MLAEVYGSQATIQIELHKKPYIVIFYLYAKDFARHCSDAAGHRHCP